MTTQGQYIIYVDTGGTFSDAVIVKPDGTFSVGKAPTVYDNLDECFFSCIQSAAEGMGKSLEEALAGADEIGYGTTIGTNIMVTGEGGPKLGFVTTKGHEDRTVIVRNRAVGFPPMKAIHIIGTDNPRPLIPRRLIKGVTERMI